MLAEAKEEMSFLDHLEELRWRVIKSLVAIAALAIPCGIFWKPIFDIIMIYPLRLSNPAPHLIYTGPAEAVVLTIKIAVAGGVICASPIIFYQLWRFISPGLYKKEKVVILPVVFASTLFFLLGVVFSYMSVPFVIKFLSQFAQGKLDAYYRANEYLGFLLKLVLAFGCVFELPVLSFTLTKIGVLTPGFLVKNLRYAVVVIFIVAALLTPPDIISQLFLALPLLVLYGISILVSFVVMKRERKSD